VSIVTRARNPRRVSVIMATGSNPAFSTARRDAALASATLVMIVVRCSDSRRRAIACQAAEARPRPRYAGEVTESSRQTMSEGSVSQPLRAANTGA
jgi:hypothetical protein